MDIDPRQYENIVSFDFCFGFFFFSTIDRDELGSVWFCSTFFISSLSKVAGKLFDIGILEVTV